MLEKTKDNLLIKVGVTLFSCTSLLFLYFYSDLEKLDVTPEIQKIKSFSLLVILTLIIAPILEELTFRSVFAKFKFSFLLSTICIMGYILVTKNHYLLILLFLFIILFVMQKLGKMNVNRFFLYISNSIIFSLVHYKTNDFNNFITIIPMFFQLSVGLILIWITLNYGLIKSVLFHFFYNFIFILVLFYTLQFPNITSHSIEYNEILLTWNKTPILNAEGTKIIIPNEQEIEVKSASISTFLKLKNIKDDRLSIKENHFLLFNIKIKCKSNNHKKLDEEDIIQLLTKADLVEFK